MATYKIYLLVNKDIEFPDSIVKTFVSKKAAESVCKKMGVFQYAVIEGTLGVDQ